MGDRSTSSSRGEDGLAKIQDGLGVGIPADQLDRVFDMFARIQGPGSQSEQGLGIGLALARQLATLHGGTLTAASAGEKRGASLTLALPALASTGAPSGTSERPAPVRSDGAALKVVIVEDNEDIAETMTDLLSDLGYDVKAARTGTEGVTVTRDSEPDVVLCDIGLPGMDGTEVCRAIRALPLAKQPVMVALTGWGREDDRRRTREAGFDHHLVKPVTSNVLLDLLKSIHA
ncbi:MAG: response regulator [Polyangiaceae bacterium]